MTTHNLRHVQDDNGGLETDTQTSNQTTSNDGTKGGRVGRGGDLDDDTKEVDETTDNNSPLAADELGDISSDESSKEGTGRQDRGDQRQVGIGEGGSTVALDGLVEDLGARDAVDVARIITEEDTTERGKGTDDICLPGDGGFDAFDIGGGVQAGSRNDRVVAAVLLLVGRHDGRARASFFPPLVVEYVWGCVPSFCCNTRGKSVLTLTVALLKVEGGVGE